MNLSAQLDFIGWSYDNEPEGEFDPRVTTELEYETDEHPTTASIEQRVNDGWELCWRNKDTGARRYAREVNRNSDGDPS